MTTQLSAPSPEEWKIYEESPTERQKFIERYRAEIKMVPITTENSVQAGDHLVREGKFDGPSMYYHHMLCTSIDNNNITVIHYTGTSSPGISAFFSCISFGDSGIFGKVCEETFTFTKLTDYKVMKVIWPDVLKRFTVTEVIDRARGRLGENNYSPFKNNCEHFVTWCICGLKVSLQVKGWYQTALEFVKSVGAGLLISGRNKFVQVILVKIVTNISDEAIQSPIGTFVQNFPVVYGVGVALEVCWAIYGLIKARKSCKTEEELKVSRVEIFAKASGRLFFGIAGSVLFGAATFPDLVGGTIGAALGHILGFGTGQLYENRNYIDG